MIKNLIGKLILITLGSILLVYSFYLFKDRNEFVSRAVDGTGTVVSFGSGYSRRISTGQTRSSNSRRPIVRFTLDDGTEITFTSATGGNLIRRYVNQQVKVKYLPDDPETAEINEPLPLWGYVIIVIVLGATIFSFGMILLLVPIINKMFDIHYMKHGQSVEISNISIDCNYRVSSLGMHPFKIVAEGVKPFTNDKAKFTSHTIWGNPDAFATKNIRSVYLIERNGKYRFVI
ncbi:MAG: DUF3592 domain-containing protein [Spirochaetes bacterium]|nr:DUF3592 domain-containing protein [Spirochaetota bacterium]MBU1081558.1 DUF3592 domain-containing protein [Spirochaetota bacterium]